MGLTADHLIPTDRLFVHRLPVGACRLVVRMVGRIAGKPGGNSEVLIPSQAGPGETPGAGSAIRRNGQKIRREWYSVPEENSS